jgi:hypothetical protein
MQTNNLHQLFLFRKGFNNPPSDPLLIFLLFIPTRKELPLTLGSKTGKGRGKEGKQPVDLTPRRDWQLFVIIVGIEIGASLLFRDV